MFNNAKKKAGLEGEYLVLCALRESLSPEYIFFHRISIPNKYSKTGYTECDIIVLGRTSIFIVEVKNISGIIICNNEEKSWTVKKIKKDTSGKETANSFMELFKRK